MLRLRNALARWHRKVMLAQLSRLDASKLVELGHARLVRAFRKTAAASPAYRALLEEHGVNPGEVRDVPSFRRHAPFLNKPCTFGRFSMAELCLPRTMDALATVLTSSGHGGTFAFGLTTRRQARRATGLIDLGLEQTFGVDRHKTLLINCLPMGVGFASDAVTVAETSVREDMAVGLLEAFGQYFDQAIIVTDPLFSKRLLDHADQKGYDWSGLKTHMVLGEETFGENQRAYIEARLGHRDADEPPFVGSSMGIAELGLNLFFETRETVALRRLVARDSHVRDALLAGQADGPQSLPMIFAYNPLRTFVELKLDDEAAFGQPGELVISLIEGTVALPLLRYETGDVAALLDTNAACRCLREAGHEGVSTPLPLIAIYGRTKELLPNGRTVVEYKDALYADAALARQLSGAFRLEWNALDPVMHVQLAEDRTLGAEEAAERLAPQLPGGPGSMTVKAWPYGSFPFGMHLDYERKFRYFSDPDAP
jgi:phenylacetate-CoA ligase